MTTKIGWTDETWNPVTGCSKCSPGCKNCYVEPLALKFQKRGILGYEKGFKVKCHPKRLRAPFKWLKPRKVFVNSMSDLFHPDVPDEFIFEVFAVMNKCPQHIFQVLTKRPERLLSLNDKILWTPNIWVGVSVENVTTRRRVKFLNVSAAKTKFISFEPLLQDVLFPAEEDYLLDGIDWVIAGGESGPSARPMQPSWAFKIMRRCAEYDIPFFFKQIGGRGRDKGGNLLFGRKYEQCPGDKSTKGADRAK